MTNTTGSAPDDARRTVISAVFGTLATQAIGLAARLDLAERIGDGDAEVAALAAACGLPEESLTRLLRVLASLGLCTEHSDGRFGLTEAGALLRSGHPASLLDFVTFLTAQVFQRNWLNVDDSLRSGQPAFDVEHGVPVYDYLSEHPELAALFHAAMSRRTQPPAMAAAISADYDFGRFTSITDVGGGDGTLLAALLALHPHLTGTVFETSAGVARAEETIARTGLAGRCRAVAGDFFAELPKGSDLYFIKNVVLNWNDSAAETILRRCRAAMPDHGRLLIVEPVLPALATAEVANHAVENPYLTDLHMLVTLGGRGRTGAEYTALLARAGLRVTGITPLSREINAALVDAVPDLTG
ncbi:methyltransferase [Micromonospora craniellae]|uniref:Methyltransferase n=1 Tax=Micromonospora craniellae TaxID=2294034 RepID=A0A372G4P6_9ACTN|nr:methyltransferase [Micromonospora craniellae]QOC90674.1 methyltransferase [Micromonospora craniellae]RFS47948.1 methyltransferase [Micromonospora craniellae]